MVVGCLHDFVDVVGFDSVVKSPFGEVVAVIVPTAGVLNVSDAGQDVLGIDDGSKDNVSIVEDVHVDVACVVFDDLVFDIVVHVGLVDLLLCVAEFSSCRQQDEFTGIRPVNQGFFS